MEGLRDLADRGAGRGERLVDVVARVPEGRRNEIVLVAFAGSLLLVWMDAREVGGGRVAPVVFLRRRIGRMDGFAQSRSEVEECMGG